MSEEVVVWKDVSQLEFEIMEEVENNYNWIIWKEQSIHKVIGWTNRFAKYNCIHTVPTKYHSIKLENGLVFKLQRVYTAEGFTGIDGLKGKVYGEYRISKEDSVGYLWKLIRKLQDRIWRLEDLTKYLEEEVKRKSE